MNIPDEQRLIEMLATGYSLQSISAVLGYRTWRGLHATMKRRRIRRIWVDGGIPVVEVRR